MIGYFLAGVKLSVAGWILRLIGFILANSHAWYVIAIVIFYTAFYLIFKVIKNEKVAFTTMGIFIMCYITVSLLLGHSMENLWLHGEWWFNTTPLFFVGMVIARFEDCMVSFIKKNYILLLTSFIILFMLFFSGSLYTLFRYSYWAEFNGGSGIPERWICLSFQVPTIIFFVFTIFTIGLKLQCSGPILRFLGTITLELYLIHNLFIELFRSPIMNIKSDILYLYLVLLCSVSVAFVLNWLDGVLIKLFKGKKGEVNDEKISLN